MQPTGSTYTSPYGSTTPGSSMQSFTNALNTITGSGGQNSPTQQQANQATSGVVGMQQNYPAYMQKAQTQLTQQSGIPQLQQQYGNMGQIFQMYLADQNYAQKYASQQNTNPYSNSTLTQAGSQAQEQFPTVLGTSTVANPYLASPSQIIASSMQPSGQGFQGFTAPSLNTGAMNVVPSAASNIMNLLQGAIGGEQGLVGNALNTASGDYQSALGALTTLANVYQQQQANQLAEQGGVLGTETQNLRNSITTDAQSGTTLTDLINKYRPLGVDSDSILQLYQAAGYYKDKNGNPSPLTQNANELTTLGISPSIAKSATQNATPKVITDAQGNKYFQDPATGQITPWSQKSSPSILDNIGGWLESLFKPPSTNNSASGVANTSQIRTQLKNEGFTDAQISEYLQAKGLS